MLKKKNTWYSIIVIGLFTGLLLFTIYFLLQLVNHEVYSWLFSFTYTIPFIGMWFVAQRVREKILDGYINYKEAYFTSLLTGIISALTFAGLIYFVYTVLNPNDINYRVLQLEQLIVSKSGKTNIEEIQMLRNKLNLLLSVSYLTFLNMIFHILLAILYAFIIAIFVRRKNRYIEA